MTTNTAIRHSSHCAKCAVCPCRCCRNKRATCSCLKKASLNSEIKLTSHQRRCLLILVRHGMSEDEVGKRYSGWNDCDLSYLGQQQMHRTGQALRQANFSIDICFTSLLKRAIKSLFIIQEETDHLWVPVYNTWRLNDRMLGNLSGFHRDRAEALFGQNQIKQWLTQPYLAPPPLELSNISHPQFSYKYRHISSIVPSTETLVDVQKRLLPFFYDQLLNNLCLGQNILLVTHEDIIKAIIRLVNNFLVNEFDDQYIPIGVPLLFELALHTNEFYNGYYLSSTLIETNTHNQQPMFPTGFNNEQVDTNQDLNNRSHLLESPSKSSPQKTTVYTDTVNLPTGIEHIRDVSDPKTTVSLHIKQQETGLAMLSTTDIALYELATPNQPNQNDSTMGENSNAFSAHATIIDPSHQLPDYE